MYCIDFECNNLVGSAALSIYWISIISSFERRNVSHKQLANAIVLPTY